MGEIDKIQLKCKANIIEDVTVRKVALDFTPS